MSGNICDLRRTSYLGGGIPGAQPPGGLLGGGAGSTGGTGMEGGGTRGRNREELRTGFGRFHCHKNKKAVITPFRQAYNAGDLNGTVCERILPDLYGPNPLNNNLGPASSLLKFEHSRGIKNGGGSQYTGNPRFVYDGSDYVRFKRLVAKNKTYNDSSFGGASYQAGGIGTMWSHRHYTHVKNPVPERTQLSQLSQSLLGDEINWWNNDTILMHVDYNSPEMMEEFRAVGFGNGFHVNMTKIPGTTTDTMQQWSGSTPATIQGDPDIEYVLTIQVGTVHLVIKQSNIYSGTWYNPLIQCSPCCTCGKDHRDKLVFTVQLQTTNPGYLPDQLIVALCTNESVCFPPSPPTQ